MSSFNSLVARSQVSRASRNEQVYVGLVDYDTDVRKGLFEK